jgi:transcriptional repressor NrdR
MRCPFCKNQNTQVIDSRSSEEGTIIKRRRKCLNCGKRFSTAETMSLFVVKRSGKTEPFSKQKLTKGIIEAFKGRSYNAEDIDELVNQVINILREKNSYQVDSYDIGYATLKPLKKLDKIAYLKFASVYKGFSTIDDYSKALAELLKEK